MLTLFPMPGKHMALAVLLSGFSLVSHALTFDEALRLALTQAPQVKVRTENLASAQASRIPAGELPDPKMVLGVDNLPIDGPDRFSLGRDFMTMRRVGVMQEVPNSAKRKARRSVADGRVDVAQAEIEVEKLFVLRETAVAWIARDTVERQLARIDALFAENRLLDAAVRAQLVGGRGMATDIVMPRQEAAMIEDRRDALQARRGQAVATLRRWIGASADMPLEGQSPDPQVENEVLARALPRHPELEIFAPKARVIDAEIAEAQAAKTPDWGIELAYQKRGPQFSDMAMVQVSFDLPLFTRSRQDPKIAAKRAERIALDAEREAVLREHAAMLESDFTEYQRLHRAAQRERAVLLPLADEKVALATAAWRGGTGSLADLAAARRERIETELKTIALEGEARQMAARLHYTYGVHGREQQ